MMGAPTVMVEKIPRGEEIVHAFKALQTLSRHNVRRTRCRSRPAGSTRPRRSRSPPSSASRSSTPTGWAARSPSCRCARQRSTASRPRRWRIADEKGNSAVIDTINNRWTETLARTLDVDMGCSAMIAIYPDDRQAGQGNVRAQHDLPPGADRHGRSAKLAPAHTDPVDAVRQATDGYRHLARQGRRHCSGARRPVSRAARRRSPGSTSYDGRSLRIAFQNEFLVAQTDDEVLATTPDLITVLDAETGEPITTEGLRYGFRVSVLSMPGDPRWRTAGGLEGRRSRVLWLRHSIRPDRRASRGCRRRARLAEGANFGNAGRSRDNHRGGESVGRPNGAH